MNVVQPKPRSPIPALVEWGRRVRRAVTPRRGTRSDRVSLVLHWLGVGDVVVCWSILKGLESACKDREIRFYIKCGDDPELADHILEWAKLGWGNSYLLTDETLSGNVLHVGHPDDTEADPEHLGVAGLRHVLWAEKYGVSPGSAPLSASPAAAESASEKLHSMGLDPHRPTVYLSPVTNNRWRNWPIDKWQQLDSALAERGVQTVIGALHPKPWASRQQLEAFSSRYFVGKESPDYLVGLLSRMDCIVSNDSGLAHVGGALGVPTIAICGGKYDGHAGFGWYDSVQVLQAPSRRIDDVPLHEALDTIEATLFKQGESETRRWR